jgi:hypothetical protein
MRAMLTPMGQWRKILINSVMQNIVRTGIGYVVAIIATFLLQYVFVYADASFYLYPDSGVYTIGETFDVEIRVDTGEDTITSAGGSIAFNKEELHVVNVAMHDSIFTSWVPAEGPSFSNETGEVFFEGFVAKGYKGKGGSVITITFEALRNVSSKVKFQTGSAILALDGKGTNILTEMSTGLYALNPKEVVPDIEYVVRGGDTPDESFVTSVTHPLNGSWAATTSALFSWELPDDVTAVRLMVDEIPDSAPTKVYMPAIAEKLVPDMAEGKWYFHAQLKNANGWGDIDHYNFNIDLTPPTINTFQEVPRNEPQDPNVKLRIVATDTPSGIERYEIMIGNEMMEWIPEEGEEVFTPEGTFGVGEYRVQVTAYDYAGNSSEARTGFSVAPIDTPVITSYPSLVSTVGEVTIEGETYPRSDVTILFEKDAGAPVRAAVESDPSGKFAYTLEGALDDGEYTIWAEVVTPEGAASGPGTKVKMTVQPTGVIIFGEKAFDVLLIFVPVLGLIAFIILILLYTLKRVKGYKRAVGREVGEAEEALHAAFETLRANNEETIMVLENIAARRPLNPEEEEVLIRLREDLANAEQTVMREIADIRQVGGGAPTEVVETHESVKHATRNPHPEMGGGATLDLSGK